MAFYDSDTNIDNESRYKYYGTSTIAFLLLLAWTAALTKL